MKSGLHMSEYSNGGLPPGSPEAKAAIERVGRAHNGGKAWKAGTVLETTRKDAHRPGHERLTEQRVRDIKRVIRNRRKSHREIAADFGVSLYMVKSISRGASFADVEVDDDEVAA